MIGPKTRRRLAPHEILRDGDLCDDMARPTTCSGIAVKDVGLWGQVPYYRKIRPSPKPGYRWADAGEEASFYLTTDGDVMRRLLSYQDLGRERYDSPRTSIIDSGAVMPWPEDPRPVAEPAEKSQADHKNEVCAAYSEWLKSQPGAEKQSREKREHEAWEQCVDDDGLSVWSDNSLGVGEQKIKHQARIVRLRDARPQPPPPRAGGGGMSEEKRRREHKARVLAEHVEGWFWVDGPHVRLGGEERGEVLSPDEVVTLRDGLNDLLREMGVEE